MSRVKKSLSEKKAYSIFVYMDLEFKTKVEGYARKHKLTHAQLSREGILMRMSGDTYNKGFNDGLNEAKRTVRENKAAGMKFPSGVSIAEYVCEDLDKLMRSIDE